MQSIFPLQSCVTNFTPQFIQNFNSLHNLNVCFVNITLKNIKRGGTLPTERLSAKYCPFGELLLFSAHHVAISSFYIIKFNLKLTKKKTTEYIYYIFCKRLNNCRAGGDFNAEYLSTITGNHLFSKIILKINIHNKTQQKHGDVQQSSYNYKQKTLINKSLDMHFRIIMYKTITFFCLIKQNMNNLFKNDEKMQNRSCVLKYTYIVRGETNQFLQ